MSGRFVRVAFFIALLFPAGFGQRNMYLERVVDTFVSGEGGWKITTSLAEPLKLEATHF